MRRLPLLDLGCGAGGASWGYWLSGLFRPVGVDIRPQPNYPFLLLEMDALDLTPERIAEEFSAVHASMPCQHFSDLAFRNGNADDHPDLIAPMRELLNATGLPWAMENIPEAPLVSPVCVCGTAECEMLQADPSKGNHAMLYRLRRHRHFESNVDLTGAFRACACGLWRHVPVLDVSGGGPTHAPRTDGAGGRTYKGTADQVREIMGMPWATKAECNEAIPPKYTLPVAPFLYAAARDQSTRRRRARV